VPPIKTVWGQRILAARLAAGLTQVEVAHAMGVVQQVVSRWELGIAAPRDDNRRRLARLLGVNPSELFAYPDDDTDDNGDEKAA